jgi:hypothetical protein
MTLRRNDYTDDRVGDLLRRSTPPQNIPDYRSDPAAFARYCREAADQLGTESSLPVLMPSAPSGSARGRGWAFLACTAAAILIFGAIIYIAWPAGSSDRSRHPDSTVVFEPVARPTGFSGPEPEMAGSRSVTFSVPPLPTAALGGIGQGRVLMAEFGLSGTPRVWPHADVLCPVVLPGQESRLGENPIIRARGGRKCVLILITDRPAAAALEARASDWAGCEPEEDLAAAATKFVVAQLRSAGIEILSFGTHTLEPMPH